MAGLEIPHTLSAEWQLMVTASDVVLHPRDLPEGDHWKPAEAPGTAFKALYGQGADLRGGLVPLHDHDIWYRAHAHLIQGEKLKFDGLAGLAEIWIDDEMVASTTSMFRYLVVDVVITGHLMIAIRFKSLNKALQKTSGRARWRTKLVSPNTLRMYRQTLLGHMPGWCPKVHAIGPYRPIFHLRGSNLLETYSIQSRMQGCRATLSVRLKFLSPLEPETRLKIQISHHILPLVRLDGKSFELQVTLTDLEPWWPHTHGDPKLYEILLSDDHSTVNLGKTGFRNIKVSRGVDNDKFQIIINGLPIFCRGACWTNADLIGLSSDRGAYSGFLVQAKNAGMNMIRVGGTMLYESKHLHDLCDELGILVWQDLMFANLDYPVDDQAFKEDVQAEVEQLLERTSASPSLVVICGGSEVVQQAVMLGLPRDRWNMPFFDTLLADILKASRSDIIYIPNTPWGGASPISVNAGVAHYYGVGAYERSLDDVRRADVRFAAECLAFANLPFTRILTREVLLDGPQDPTATWTFADIRDYYLKLLYNVDPTHLRRENPARYSDLSQVTTSDLMELVFSEWRRPKSSCAGGLVWQLQDLAMGSGWGVIDSEGRPKSVWYGLRRSLAPIQILISDEGVNGIDLHILNERPTGISVIIRLKCLNNSSIPIIELDKLVLVEARDSVTISSYTLIDGFFDITRAYRFGPAEHKVTAVSIVCPDSGNMLSQAFHFPTGRDLPIEDIGLDAEILYLNNLWIIKIKTKLFAQSVSLDIDGYLPDDNWFHMTPNNERIIKLVPITNSRHSPNGKITALNSKKTYFLEVKT